MTATDLVLTVTQILRKHGVVDKFVEFFGPGLDSMSLPDRALVSNMSPEYGATMGYFPVDAETLRYMRLSGRPEELIALTEAYCRAQGLFRDANSPEPEYTETLELDLGSVVPSLAGPKRPQDRVALERYEIGIPESPALRRSKNAVMSSRRKPWHARRRLAPTADRTKSVTARWLLRPLLPAPTPPTHR